MHGHSIAFPCWRTCKAYIIGTKTSGERLCRCANAESKKHTAYNDNPCSSGSGAITSSVMVLGRRGPRGHMRHTISERHSIWHWGRAQSISCNLHQFSRSTWQQLHGARPATVSRQQRSLAATRSWRAHVNCIKGRHARSAQRAVVLSSTAVADWSRIRVAGLV